MDDKNPIFSQSTCDLGTDTDWGAPLGQVDSSFESLRSYTPGTTCIVCKQGAKYQLIPKKHRLLSALIQTKGFVCEHCLRTHINPEEYSVRDISSKGKKNI